MLEPRPPRFPIEPFTWSTADPQAETYEAVAELIRQVVKSGYNGWRRLIPARFPAARRFLAANPAKSADLVLALIAHVEHYENLKAAPLALATTQSERDNWHLSPETLFIKPGREVAHVLLRKLLRRKLPLTAAHLEPIGWGRASGTDLSIGCSRSAVFSKP